MREAAVHRKRNLSLCIRARVPTEFSHATRERSAWLRPEPRPDSPPQLRTPQEAVRNLLDTSTRRSSLGRPGAPPGPISGSSRSSAACSTACRNSTSRFRRAGANQRRMGSGEGAPGAPQRLSAMSTKAWRGRKHEERLCPVAAIANPSSRMSPLWEV